MAVTVLTASCASPSGLASSLASDAARTARGSSRVALSMTMHSVGGPLVPAQAWVDATGLVRRVSVTLTPGKHSGVPAGAQFTEMVDFYDFGVPVHVSAPPASEVMSPSQASDGFIGSAGPGGMTPPPASGPLSPAQASAAEQAVRAFWAGLGAGDLPAAAQAVLPAQRKCFLSTLKGMPRFTVASLRIVSARPDKTGHAAVLFTATIRMRVHGHSIPVAGPPGSGSKYWLVTTAAGSGWYVDLPKGPPYFPFFGPCGASTAYSSFMPGS